MNNRSLEKYEKPKTQVGVSKCILVVLLFSVSSLQNYTRVDLGNFL